MKDKFFFLICFLAIFCIFYYKFKQFSAIIEGVKCDPNKPKVYGKPSAQTCQKLRESQGDDNIEVFKRKLNDVKTNVNNLLKKYRNVLNKHKENNNSIKESIKGLNCAKLISIPLLNIFILDCGKPAEKDKNDKPEVDIAKLTRDIIIPSNGQKRNIGGMAL